MALCRLKVLILLICATFMVGANAAAKTEPKKQVLAGTFNSRYLAQQFFENLPAKIQEKIPRDRLKWNLYKTPHGFLVHFISFEDIEYEKALDICVITTDREVQCLVLNKGQAHSGQRRHAYSYKGLSTNHINPPKIDFSPAAALKAHKQEFSFQQKEKDTSRVGAAKAAYNSVKTNLIETIQAVGNGINNDTGKEATKQQLEKLAQDAFEAAGDAYLSNFLEKGNSSGDAGQSGDDRPVFVQHLQNNLQNNFTISAKTAARGLLKKVTNDLASGKGLDAVSLNETIDDFILSSANSLVDAGLAAARRSDLYALRHLELEYNLNEFEDSYFSFLTTQPIYQTNDLRHNVFLQGGAIINEESVDIDDDTNRHTINFGAAYRYLTPDEKYLFGGNIFFDHQFPYDHTRMSIGADVKAENLNFAANYYIPITGFQEGRRDAFGNQYEERALEGFDLELGYTPEQIPNLTLFGKGYNYFRETDDDLRGIELSGEYKLNKNLLLKGSLIEENGGRDGIEFALQYSIPLYDDDNIVLADITPAAGSESQRDRIFEKVRRENRIRLEERLLEGGDVDILTAQFSGFSTGLPFDVGGTAISSGVDIPFNTAITIPNGDFGIINFSNGAIANVSASGAGDVILEFNETTLTVTATNGGFVQFISGSGGISVVNVPGGTVNLLGTDIDVTDDGTTTTIQVRAGQIDVIPNVGVDTEIGNQGDVVSLTIATGATTTLAGAALTTRQDSAFTNLDSQNPSPPNTSTSAPFISATPALITGPQVLGDNADLRLTFSQSVSVGGAPFINAIVDANPRTFAYDAGASSSTQLVFRHVFVAADAGSANITIQDLDLNGGSITGSTNGLDALIAYPDTVVPIVDIDSPTLVSTTPVDNEPAFGAAVSIVLNFDENVQAGAGNILITDTTDGSDNRIIPIGDAQVNISGATVTIDPSTSLEQGTDYDVTIIAGVIEDTAGNDFDGISSGELNFTTDTDMVAPLLTGTTPNDNDIQIARADNITLTFNEDVVVSGTITLTDTDDGSGTASYTAASSEVSVASNVITINPSSDLEYAENYEVTWTAGAIQDASGNNAAASNSGDLNFRTVNLEETLTLTLNINTPDDNVDENNVQGSGVTIPTAGTYVMALDINIPASPSGLIFECGGAGQGQYVGFNTTDSVLRLRGGEGGNAPPDTDMTFLDIPFASIPAGDFTLTFEYEFATTRIRAWLDENLLGSATASGGALESNRWSGGDNCTFVDDIATSITVGEIGTAFNGSLNTPGVRYYSGQTVP